MFRLAFAGLAAALVSVAAMSGAIIPLHGSAYEAASFVFLISAIATTLGFAAADG